MGSSWSWAPMLIKRIGFRKILLPWSWPLLKYNLSGKGWNSSKANWTMSEKVSFKLQAQVKISAVFTGSSRPRRSFSLMKISKNFKLLKFFHRTVHRSSSTEAKEGRARKRSWRRCTSLRWEVTRVPRRWCCITIWRARGMRFSLREDSIHQERSSMKNTPQRARRQRQTLSIIRFWKWSMNMISHVARINCLHRKSTNMTNNKNNIMKSSMKRSIKKSNKINNTKKNKAKNPNKAKNILKQKISNNWTNLIDSSKREPKKCSHHKLSKLLQVNLYLSLRNRKMLQQWTRVMLDHRSKEVGLSTSRTRVRRCSRPRYPKREPESVTASIRLRTWLHTCVSHHRASNWSSNLFSFLSRVCPCKLHPWDRQFHWTLNSKDLPSSNNRDQSS